MFVLAPIPITDAVLTASNLPETDYAAWSSGTAYSTGALVIVTSTSLPKSTGETWAQGQAIYWNAALNLATTDEIADCWVDDEEDKKNMALPDIRTTASRPDYYPNF